MLAPNEVITRELAGVSVPEARVRLLPPAIDAGGGGGGSGGKRKGRKRAAVEATGPLLVTHAGISGPAVLRLSAFGARQLHAADYRGEVGA